MFSYNLTFNVTDADDTCPYIMLRNDTQHQQPIIVYENDPVVIRYVTVDPDTDHALLMFTRDSTNSNDTNVSVFINSTGVYPTTGTFHFFISFF